MFPSKLLHSNFSFFFKLHFQKKLSKPEHKRVFLQVGRCEIGSAMHTGFIQQQLSETGEFSLVFPLRQGPSTILRIFEKVTNSYL